MNKSDVSFSDIPDVPGVYRFIGAGKKILYVGKATSLRDRVRSYFVDDIRDVRSPLIEKIISDAVTIEWEETDSVLEALILEAKLIKKHKPIGNTREKDNKSFNYVVITDEEVPRILLVREREIATSVSLPYKVKKIFGPFPQGKVLKEGLKVIRKIFPFYDTSFPITKTLSPAQEKTVTFNRSIGLFPSTDVAAYKKTVRHIALLFDAKKGALLKELEKDMQQYAKEKKFEEAAGVKKKLFALKHIQDITLIREDLKRPSAGFRVEAFDTAHLQGASPRGVMVVLEDGEPKKQLYRTFTIRTAKGGDDLAALAEIIERRAKHDEWTFPDLVVVDGGKTHLTYAQRMLEKVGITAPVVSVVKDEKHRPKSILGDRKLIHTHEADVLLANAEAHRFSISKHRRALRRRSGT